MLMLIIIKSIILYGIDKNEEALKSINEAINLNPKYYGAYYHKNVILEDMGRDKDALDAINKTINLNPKYYEAYCYRISILSHMKDKAKEAISAVKESIRLNHECPNNLLSLDIEKNFPSIDVIGANKNDLVLSIG